MTDTLRTVAVNGVTLHYAVAGQGRPVILVHGNGESHAMFRREMAQLSAAGYRVYAPDSRGHGANDPLGEYHYADMAEDMYQFIRVLGLDKPCFYGFSDGGIVGLLLALRHPEALSALAVSGANLTPEGVQPDFLAEIRAENDRCPNPLVTLMLTEPHIDPEALRRITVPTLVTAGEHDLIREQETRRIAAHIPGARLVIVPGHDHGSYIDGSDVMGELLLDFLATLPLDK